MQPWLAGDAVFNAFEKLGHWVPSQDMSRFVASSVVLLVACAQNAPPAGTPRTAVAEPTPEPALDGVVIPESEEPALPVPAPRRAPLMLQLTPAPMGELPASWAAHPWAEAITSPKDGQQVAPEKAADLSCSLSLPKQEQGATLFLQLDDFAPVVARSGLKIGEMHFEWDTTPPGVHRLVLFAADSDGRALLRDASPLLDVVYFSIGSDTAQAEPSKMPRQALLSPHGTLNGETSASDARVQFWTDTEEPVAVKLTAVDGRTVEHLLSRGGYTLSPLPSGDYSVDVATAKPMRTVITVNRELSADVAP